MTYITRLISTRSSFGARAVAMAVLVLGIIAVQPQRVNAQWTTTGNNISNTNSGNVGVGTSSPTSKVEIVNPAGGLNYSNYLRVTGSTADNANYPGITLKGGTLANEYPFIGLGNGGLYLTVAAGRHGTNHPNRMQLALSSNSSGSAFVGFQLYNGSATTDLLRVNDNGNVGIGTTSPLYSLDVNGGANGFRAKASTSLATDTIVAFESAGGIRAIVRANGNVGIGVTAPTEKLDVVGNLKLTGTGNINASGTITGGTIQAKYQDVAEWVESSQALGAGTVVVLDQTKSNQVIACTQAYDTRVAGVISLQPGITLGENGLGKVLVATTGRVRIKVDASHGPIHIGDLLVTSDISGVAMKSKAIDVVGVQIHRPGTLIGKALEPLANGSGTILVLLSLQ